MKPLSFEAHRQRLRARYAQRGKPGKSRLLDECCEHHGYSRKHAIKLLRDRLPKRKRRVRGVAPPRYDPIREVIERFWGAAEQPCGKRQVMARPLWLPHYAKRFGRLLPCQKSLLSEVSAATLDRLLARERALGGRGLCGTRPGRRVRHRGKTTTEIVYLISSLPLEQLQAAGWLRLKRGYWVIESRRHHSLDVSLDEDRSRVRQGNAAWVLGMIRR